MSESIRSSPPELPSTIDVVGNMTWLGQALMTKQIVYDGKDFFVRTFGLEPCNVGRFYWRKDLIPSPTKILPVWHACSILNLPSILEKGIISTKHEATLSLIRAGTWVVQKADAQSLPIADIKVAAVIEGSAMAGSLDISGCDYPYAALTQRHPSPKQVMQYLPDNYHRPEDVVYLPPENIQGFYVIAFEINGFMQRTTNLSALG